jgi:hypothetical protein
MTVASCVWQCEPLESRGRPSGMGLPITVRVTLSGSSTGRLATHGGAGTPIPWADILHNKCGTLSLLCSKSSIKSLAGLTGREITGKCRVGASVKPRFLISRSFPNDRSVFCQSIHSALQIPATEVAAEQLTAIQPYSHTAESLKSVSSRSATQHILIFHENRNSLSHS